MQANGLKRLLAVLGLAAISIVCALMFLRYEHVAEDVEVPSGSTEPAADDAAQAEAHRRRTEAVRGLQIEGADGVLGRQGKTTPPPSPFGSRSAEDDEWLRRHLYPTADDIALAGTLPLPLDEMPRSAADLANAAKAIEGEALREAAGRTLENGAGMGSVQALVALAAYYEVRDPILSQAYYRAAIMRGDWMLALRLKPNLDNGEDALATMAAIEILDGINRQRLARGLPPLGRETRPGLTEFIHEYRMALMMMRELDDGAE